MTAVKQVYQLKISLAESKPPIWRRVLVPANTRLDKLHEIIQKAMGWENYHLHMFTIDGQRYGDPEDDETGDLRITDETRHRLDKLGLREKSKFGYEYDFGDSWGHTILLEKILPAEPGASYPHCVTGKRACPPEDVGGIWGYQEFLEIIAAPEHPEHARMLEWVGGDFDPNLFDVDEANEMLAQINPAADIQAQAAPPLTADQRRSLTHLAAWVASLSPDDVQRFEDLPILHDVRVFLEYLQNNRVVGTQTTGNLPLKAVREICQQFTYPPALEETIGSRTYKIRSEDDVWQLVFLHAVAFHANLVDGGLGRRWQVTGEGLAFGKLPAPVQCFFLFRHWFMDVEWLMAFPFAGLGETLPVGFRAKTRSCLLELPINRPVSYEAFANRLMEQGNLTWGGSRSEDNLSILQAAVQRMVVHPLAIFGVLVGEFTNQNKAGDELSVLSRITLTQHGKQMLEMMEG